MIVSPPKPKAPDANQHEMDFLMPFSERRPLLTPQEAARCLGRTEAHVYDLIGEGKLEALAPTDREKRRYMVTRRSVLAVLAEQFVGEPDAHLPRILAVLRTLTTRAEISTAMAQLGQQLQTAQR